MCPPIALRAPTADHLPAHACSERELRRSTGFDVAEEVPRSGGSYDTGDPSTTNLYVGNLAPSVEEHTLMVLFGKYGPVASVKIMWPRETEERPRGHTHTGFVAFMARQSAEDALQHLQGHLLHDHELRLGWGKAVPLPPVPVWPPAAGPPLVLAPGQAAPPPPVAPIHTREVAVRVPLSASRACLVDTLAAYVAVDGLAFEQAVMEREQSNPVRHTRAARSLSPSCAYTHLTPLVPLPQDFGFLFDPDCADHQYYRWRVYSLTQGDTLAQWRQEPFLIQQGGAVWHPPRRAEGPPSGLQAERQLTDEERDQLEGALRGLTMRRQSVAAAMVFAFDHAQAARDVADTLVEALNLSETPPSTKLARLYLLSDLLHNCTTSVPGAAAYRSHLLSAALPEVFESLHSACLALDSRISALAMKQRVQAVLRTWPELFLFTELFLSGLEWSFYQPLAALPASEGLRTELLAMSADQLTMRCRRSGLVPGTEQQTSVDRLLALDCFRRASRGESAPSAEAPPVPQFSQPSDRQAGGGWTTVTHAPAATAGVKRVRDDGRDVQ